MALKTLTAPAPPLAAVPATAAIATTPTCAQPSAPRHNQRGSSLIEVLIAVLLMSLCLLGIAALLGATTRFQLGVNSRAQLTLLLNDAAGRIRANVSEIPGYDTAAHAAPYTYSANWDSQQGSIAAAAVNCAASACTPSQRAGWDLVALRNAARSALPQGSMLISGDVNVLTVTYLWMDKDFTTGSPPVLRTSKTCATGNTGIQAQTCCPAAAAVNSTPGVRCFNMNIVP